MTKTRHQALCDALLARGETQLVHPNVTRWTIFTRRYRGERLDKTGELVPSASTRLLWFVSRAGTLRMGPSVTQSVRVKPRIVGMLLLEGGYKRS